jgi:hypothetical protein
MAEYPSHEVDCDYFYSEIVEKLHVEVRNKLEPLVDATYNLPVSYVLSSLSLHISRLALATFCLAKSGFSEENQLPFRACSEAFINLIYILDVGPILGDKTDNGLAEQFIAYGDVAYHRWTVAHPKLFWSALKNNTSYTDAEIKKRLDSLLAKREEAINNHNCTIKRWHKLSLVDMAESVRKNLPTGIEDKMANLLFTSFNSPNSATHVDALSIRTQQMELQNKPLEIKFTDKAMHANATGQMTMWAWRRMAIYFNQQDWFDKLIKTTMNELFRKRQVDVEKEISRIILLPSEHNL